MINSLFYLVLLTFFPFLELRASIPYGINTLGMHWGLVFVVCILANIALGPILYKLLDKFVHIFLRYRAIERVYDRVVERTQKKIHKYVEKYGWIGLAVFIGIPLPGSGSYSGALAAYLLGINFRKFVIANTIGVLIAGTIVTLISIGILNIF